MPGITASENSASAEASLMKTVLDAITLYCNETKQETMQEMKQDMKQEMKENEIEEISSPKMNADAMSFWKNLTQESDPSTSSSSSSSSSCNVVMRRVAGAVRNSISSSLYDHLNPEHCVTKRNSMSSHLFEYLNDATDQNNNNSSDDNNNNNNKVSEDQTLSVVKYLESHKVNNDLMVNLDALREFDECERNNDDDDSLIDFVCEFDRKYQMLYRKGITLSPQVLALKLLCKARLEKQEESLVRKGIDFSRTDRVYEEAKEALVKLAEYQQMKKGLRKEMLLRDGNKKKKKSKPQREEGDNKTTGNGRFYLILDSACSSTLCGKKWLDEYLEYLGEDLSKEVEYSRSDKSFVFGGGKPVNSLACCRMPAFLAGKMVTVVADVVPNDLPLIYSLSDMKKAGVKLDFTNDTAQIFGQLIQLKVTDSGHYSVPVDGAGVSRRLRLRQLSEEIQVLQELVNGM